MNVITRHKKFWSLLLLILVWIGVLSFVSPSEIVEMIGVKTGYLIIFITALLGISGFASAPFYASLFTLSASGELDIFLVLLIASPARTVGDILFFTLGHHGHSVIRESTFVGKKIKNFSLWLFGKPYWIVLFFSYLYTSAAPFPKDFLMIGLGVGRLKLRDVIIVALLGNATFIALVYFFAIGVIPGAPIVP
jgi:hypothetical protein